MNIPNNINCVPKLATISIAALVAACHPNSNSHEHIDSSWNQHEETHPVGSDTDSSENVQEPSETHEIWWEACMFDSSVWYEDEVKLCLNLEYAQVEITDIDSGTILFQGRTDMNWKIDINLSHPGWRYLHDNSAIHVKALWWRSWWAIRVDELGREDEPDTYGEYKIIRKAIVPEISTFIAYRDFREALWWNNEIYIWKTQIAYAHRVKKLIEDYSSPFIGVEWIAANSMGILDSNWNWTYFDDVNWLTGNPEADRIVTFGESYIHIED